MKKRILCMLLAIIMAVGMLPMGAFAATTKLTGAYIYLGSTPRSGVALPSDYRLTAAQYAATARNAKMTSAVWSGKLDADGFPMPNESYTLTITLEVMEDKDAAFAKDLDAKKLHVRNAPDSTLIERTDKKVVFSTTFTLNSHGLVGPDEPTPPPVTTDYFTQAEADKAENYPLGSPITLVANDETLKGAESLGPYSRGVRIMYHMFNATSVFHTLDGETIENKSLPCLDRFGDRTANHYRVTRVVYDYYREDDPWMNQFPNCTELWLSPKCDIDGILETLGNIESYKNYLNDFIDQDRTVFIPDSLYPNGPTYNGHPAPGCKVMLYSGDDVYAAAAKGKDAARDWCTNHSYTYQYISESRRYTFPTCCTDARFYYSCSKCGKCEYNPNHTFYPTVGSFDNGEDGGANTAHDFVNRVVTDEHYLGKSSNGDRVYLYACSVCGKDRRQAASASEKKFWASDGTGAYYNNALKNTVVGKENGYDTYAIYDWNYIAAKQDAWATGEVLSAAEKGIIDTSLMGNDYTAAVNRLQFCSVVVKMAEMMTGKAITPAPADSFTDTNNEYILKAVTAGITNGMGDGTFNPGGILNRQQMATFIYRALMYVKNNSGVLYTTYDSKLGNYSDSGQLADWAREPMAFMNALGIIKGTSDTQLSPNANCTIEQAIVAAYRSLDAGSIGWYQYTKDGTDWLNYGDRYWVYFKNGNPCFINPYGFESEILKLERGNYRPIKAV